MKVSAVLVVLALFVVSCKNSGPSQTDELISSTSPSKPLPDATPKPQNPIDDARKLVSSILAREGRGKYFSSAQEITPFFRAVKLLEKNGEKYNPRTYDGFSLEVAELYLGGAEVERSDLEKLLKEHKQSALVISEYVKSRKAFAGVAVNDEKMIDVLSLYGKKFAPLWLRVSLPEAKKNENPREFLKKLGSQSDFAKKYLSYVFPDVASELESSDTIVSDFMWCGRERYFDTLKDPRCGAIYFNKPNMKCDGSYKTTERVCVPSDSDGPRPREICKYVVVEHPATCRHPENGVEDYNTCRLPIERKSSCSMKRASYDFFSQYSSKEDMFYAYINSEGSKPFGELLFLIDLMTPRSFSDGVELFELYTLDIYRTVTYNLFYESPRNNWSDPIDL